MFCTKCGRALDDEAAFCPRCGTPVAGKGVAAPSMGASLSGIDSVIKEPAAQEYWGRRIIAYVIDALIVYLVLGILALFFALPYFFIAGFSAMMAMLAGVFSFVAGVVLVLYFTLFESWAGRTIGKAAMGLSVQSKTGGDPNIVQALSRNVSKIHWILLFLDIIVGLATSQAYTQKFSDRFVGTSVVKRQARGAPA